MTKKEQFEQFANTGKSTKKLFRPILMHFAARFNNKTYGEFASDYRVLVDSNIRAMEFFDTDMVGLISDPYRETAAFGAPVTFPAEAVPVCQKRIVQTIEDVKNLKNPDVYKSERTYDRIKGAEQFQKLLNGSVPIIGWIEGPLAEACDLAGVDHMLLQLLMDPEFSNILLDKCMITGKEFAKAQIDNGCDIIGMGDAICSQIDAGTYDTYVKERHHEIIEYIHNLGARVKLHICGDITHLLPSLADLSVDILDIDWQVDLIYAHQIVGPEVILTGNIDPIVVKDTTKDEIFEITRQLVESEQTKKHILSAGCEIIVNTPVENLRAMRDASL